MMEILFLSVLLFIGTLFFIYGTRSRSDRQMIREDGGFGGEW